MKRLPVWLVVLAVILVAAPISVVWADTPPTGVGPSDPLSADGVTWRTVAPNSTQWYYFDYSGDKSTVEVDLDNNGAANVQMAIVSPALAAVFAGDPSTSPVAWATAPASWTQSGNHNLVWRGGFIVPGRYFAVVVNKNSNPVSVRVIISGLNVLIAPTPRPSPTFSLRNPFATPVSTGSLQGRLVIQESSGGNIYTVNGDGSQLTRITTGMDPNWSPDGSKIAFSRWAEPAGLYVSNADGSQAKILLQADKVISPQWSPDGTRILFTRQMGGKDDYERCNRGRCVTITGDLHWKLGVVEAASGAYTQPQCSHHCFSATWRPDGKTVEYADAQIGLLGADSDPNGPPAWTIWDDFTGIQSTSLSPDGKQVVLMVRQNDHWEIGVMSAEGGAMMTVTHPDPLGWVAVNNVAPTWSPDGKQILFLSDRGGKWQFYTINPDGTGLKQVLKSVTDSLSIQYHANSERVADWIP